MGVNLEVFKFGMYLMFPIGIMFYFGTNLDARFSVPGFWPKAEHSHKIPFDREDMKAEYARLIRREREIERLKALRAEQQQNQNQGE